MSRAPRAGSRRRGRPPGRRPCSRRAAWPGADGCRSPGGAQHPSKTAVAPALSTAARVLRTAPRRGQILNCGRPRMASAAPATRPVLVVEGAASSERDVERREVPGGDRVQPRGGPFRFTARGAPRTSRCQTASPNLAPARSPRPTARTRVAGDTPSEARPNRRAAAPPRPCSRGLAPRSQPAPRGLFVRLRVRLPGRASATRGGGAASPGW